MNGGRNWLYGSIAPTTEGKNGDVYLNTTTGEWSYRASGSWSVFYVSKSPEEVICGEMYLNANVTATVVSATNTWYKAAGTTSNGVLTNFTDGGGKLTYTGSFPVTLRCLACVSVYSAGVGDTLGVAIFKNGSIVTSSEMEVRTTAASQAVQAACQGMVTFATNDYVEIYVQNKSATANVTMHYLNFVCK